MAESSNGKKEKALKVLKIAKENLVLLKGQLYTLKLTSDERYLKTACFYASQCTKVLLNYLIVYNEDIDTVPMDIKELRCKCEQLHLSVPKEISENEGHLVRWSMPTTYRVNFKIDLQAIHLMEVTLSEWIENLEILNT